MRIPTNPFSEENEDLSGRHIYLVAVILFAFLVLFLRMWYLQIIRGHEYRAQSARNITRYQDIAPPRGMILDRNGLVLVDNYPSYDLAMTREDVPDLDSLAWRLASLLEVSPTVLQSNIEAAKQKPRFAPAVILTDLSHHNLVRIETNRFILPGVDIMVTPQRRYLQDSLAAHVIGYLSEINQEQLKQKNYREHRGGDMAGQTGVELQWEMYMHGRRGSRMVEVDASGRTLRVTEDNPPIPGHNLHLTLDAALQRACQDALGERAGAIVAINPNNGEILAMASAPTYSQNLFVKGISPAQWKELLSNPLHPLENKAIRGEYPPGSTYKIVAAIAALEEGAVTPDEKILCTGGYKFGDRVFHCWKRGGHGRVNLHRAIKESCDIYFYEMGRRVGVNKLAQYARAFGIGRLSGLGLPGERPGLVPTKKWKKERYKKAWMAGETLSVVIGQGYNQATPLQMAQVTAVAANGGTLYHSHIIKKITDSSGRVVKAFQPEVVHRLDLAPSTVRAVQNGLAAAVNEPGGTARRARMADITVCGKTGTSQVVTLKKYQKWKKGDIPYKYRDHSWFVAFAPLENPRIALAVVIEHAGAGSRAAASVAREVLTAFFEKEKTSLQASAPSRVHTTHPEDARP